MTAAVPDPRLRDQLAEWLAMFDSDRAGMIADYLAPRVAAEVEARVQATPNQRAAEELRKAADWIWDETPALATASAELHARADDLAQPAPGDRAEREQETDQ